MQIVIEIPEELKNKIDNANEDNYRTYIWWFETTLYCAIKNGTPLPKGHGRLIDADEIQFENTEFETYGDYCIAFDAIDEAPTIIEADTEGSESE